MFTEEFQAEIIKKQYELMRTKDYIIGTHVWAFHGGGDPLLLNDIFGEPVEDKFHRAANHVDGAMSILTGVAANKSIAAGGMPIKIDDLVKF